MVLFETQEASEVSEKPGKILTNEYFVVRECLIYSKRIFVNVPSLC